MLTVLTTVVGRDTVAELRRALIRIGFAAVAEAGCFALLVPLVGALFGRRFPETLWWAAAFAGASALAFGVERRAMQALRAQVTRVIAGLHRRLGEHLVALPLGWFRPANQDRVQRLLTSGATSLATVLSGIVAVNVRAGVLGASIVVVTAAVDPVVAAVGAVGLAILGIVHVGAGRILRGATAEAADVAEQIAADLVEFGQKQSVLRSCGRSSDVDGDLRRSIAVARRAGRRYFVRAIVGVTAFALGSAILLSSVIVAVALRVDAGTVRPAFGVALVLFAALLVDAVAALGRTSSMIWAAQADVAAMAEVLAARPLPEPARSAPIRGAGVEFDAVAFGYTPDSPVLDGVSFAVPTGGSCAIVGPSGSGKTTLVRLVARFFDVTAGSVRVGGSDVRGLRAADLNRQLAVVFQDVHLVDGTIRDNVTVGHGEVSDDRLDEVARRSRLDEVLEALPDGWDTPVGDRGTALSGGQRQRVSVARALLKDAPVVLLDEATSALDPENEQAVRAAFDELGPGRTRLIVAHRLSTVRDADVIVFLDGGRAAEIGTHDELLESGGRYAGFWAEHNRIPTGTDPDTDESRDAQIPTWTNPHAEELR
ncbi:ABC transporter ATP-binding protein [Gordonia shandongensis]|uniref:ABC transporter ATP-binding protein n=1 Tax=Gordonia shandongensis TaxID=376351 RepID=UPI0003FFA2B3|nr:ABC transporter ATP-binding protein [Gordonia shandongensis]